MLQRISHPMTSTQMDRLSYPVTLVEHEDAIKRLAPTPADELLHAAPLRTGCVPLARNQAAVPKVHTESCSCQVTVPRSTG